jgi:transposase
LQPTGEVRQAQIFVAVIGASNFTYAEATWTQTLPDWLAPAAPRAPGARLRVEKSLSNSSLTCRTGVTPGC